MTHHSPDLCGICTLKGWKLKSALVLFIPVDSHTYGENLAKYFYDETNGRMAKVTNGRVHVKDVTVFETDSTTAKYSE